MEYRVLGPLEVAEQQEPLPLGGPRQRTVLADLLVNHGRVVASDRLILDLWGDEPPPAARATLQSYISNLRRVLGEHRIGSRAPGYVLQMDGDDLDAARFEALLGDARSRLATDANTAAALLEEALQLWRGEPFIDLTDASFLRPEVARLEELHQIAEDELAAAQLDLGNHVALIPRLEALVDEDPLRERLSAHLMLALYRAGRQADALDVYERLRRRLADELGIDPSPDVRRLHEQMLRQDPGLAASEPTAPLSIPVSELRNPYKGLRPFEETDAPFFFGREDLIADLSARMASESPLLVLVGPSGSGKSSVLKAGLLPALASGAVHGSDSCTTKVFSGNTRVDEIEASIARASHVARTTRAHTVMVLDQFEEFFLTENAPVHLLDTLVRGVSDPRNRLRVVVALRADLYDRPLAFRGFAELMRENTVTLLPLAPEEVVRAIAEPARRVGVSLEEGLLGEMVADVADQPGYLPLLQYALTELFERRDGSRLTLDGYRAIGGVSGALVRKAEEIYAGLDGQGREASRQVFLRLVAPGNGAEYTRRRSHRSELATLGIESRVVDEVLDVFGAHRLLSFDRDPLTRAPTVEAAHEALLREWERLRGWIDDAREDVRMHGRLAAAAEEWSTTGRDPSLLLRGRNLEKVHDWHFGSVLALATVEREYLDASVAARESELIEKRAQREREAALERRSSNRLRALVVVLSVAALVAGALSLFALGERGQARREAARAEQQARVATARELASAADANLDADPELAILLALEAVDVSSSSGAPLREAQEALRRAIHASRVELSLPGSFGSAFSPDGNTAAIADEEGSVTFWDSPTGRELRTVDVSKARIIQLEFLPGGSQIVSTTEDDGRLRVWNVRTGEVEMNILVDEDGAYSMSASPDGKRVAAAGGSGVLKVYDIPSGKEVFETQSGVGLHTHPGGELVAVGGSPAVVWDVVSGERALVVPRSVGEVRDVRFSPDGKRLATAGNDGVVRIWRLASGELDLELVGHESSSEAVDWSPDGSVVAAGGGDGTARLWDARSGKQLIVLGGQGSAVEHITFHPDGELLIGSGSSGSTKVWNVTPGGNRELLTFTAHDGSAFSSAFGPDGSLLVTSGPEGAVKVWDAATGGLRMTLPAHAAPVIDARFSPDGNLIASAGLDAALRLWDADSGELIREIALPGPVGALRFSNDGSRVAASGAGAGVWDVGTGEEVTRLDAHRGAVLDVAISPDGEMAASAGDDEIVRVWDAGSGEILHELEGHTNSILTLDFHPNGRKLASGANDGTARVWTLDGSSQVIEGHTGGVTGVAFSPDGTKLATSSSDGTARLWDPDTGEELVTLPGHESGAMFVSFRPDGRRLAVAGEDGRVRLYTLSFEELLATARERVTRSFTEAECRRYLHLETCPAPTGRRIRT